MVTTHVLTPSLTPRGGILVRMVSFGMVGVAGVVSWAIPPVLRLVHVFVLMLICMYVCVAPPNVGAWSMAVFLWQLFEYYYCWLVQVFVVSSDVIFLYNGEGMFCTQFYIQCLTVGHVYKVIVINPRCTCTARVTVLVPCVSLFVFHSNLFSNYWLRDSSRAILTTITQQGLEKCCGLC